MLQNSEIRKIYSELQKQLFYLIPEKWDRIYLYASVEEKIDGLETGELFFYYFPKGILKKNPVNVYEIPNKFNLNEGEYIKLVEKLYNEIKKLRRAFKKYNKRLWSNVTIRIEGIRFEIEYNYERLSNSNYSNIDKHIIWKYYNLKLPEESDMEAIETGIKYRNIAPVIGPLIMCKLSRELQFGDLRADASITNLLIQLYDENLRLTIGDLINNVFFLMKDKSFFTMDGEGNRYRFKINMRVPDLKKQIQDLLK